MTLIIDDQSEPGAYADKFKDAPTYGEDYPFRSFYLRAHTVEQERRILKALRDAPRCYRDRKAKERLKDTTNAIRAKLGMELL